MAIQVSVVETRTCLCHAIDVRDIKDPDPLNITYPPAVPLPAAEEVFDLFDAFIFDCDGVLWRDSDVIDGALEALRELRASGKRVFFVSNNSTKSRDTYVRRLVQLGFEAHEDEIYSSAWSAAAYLEKIKFTRKAYVVGHRGIVEELTAVGIEAIGAEDHAPHHDLETLRQWTPDPEVGAVVVGMDYNINYRKLTYAQRYLSSKECLFVATNTDASFPGQDGVIFPGGGSIVHSVSVSTGREPVVTGKPHSLILERICTKYQLDPQRTLMIGDRLETDILFGRRGNLRTLLVMTGVTTDELLKGSRLQPDFVAPSVASLVPSAKQ